MNVYLIEDDGGGVTMFDAGVQEHGQRDRRAPAAALGGINRVVLGHGHVDHRGAAPGLGAPVYCHPDNRADAEGDGGRHYADFSKLRPYARPVYPHLLDLWDGGPVQIAGTVEEGEDVSGFRVVLIAGHAPGMIALYRERDGLALTSDCFYTLDVQTGLHGPPRLPLAAFNLDTEQARASIRKLAELRPSRGVAGARRAADRRRRRAARARRRRELMGKRSRRRGARDDLAAPETEYRSPAGDVLVLRGAMSPATRREYAAAAAARRCRARTPGSGRPSSCSSASRCAGRSPAPSRSRARRSCSAATASRARTSAAGSATCCASTSPSTSPTLTPP